MSNIPEYTDGVLKVYRITTDESEDHPEEKLSDQKMKLWYREISVFDKTRYELNKADLEVTMKLRIQKYDGIDSYCICLINGKQHKVYNATHVIDKNGYRETELTLVVPQKEYEVMDNE